MANTQELANQLKAALDRIAQQKDNPDQVQQAVNDAKAKVDEMARAAGQAPQGQQR
jgi:predicted transcriptional regulator